MLRVGLTGGLASGKSFVGRALADLGCLVIRADELGHQVLEPGGAAYDGVIREFGAGILDSDVTIDRRKLAALVFHDSERLAKLNALVHPAVRARGQRIMDAFAEAEAKGSSAIQLDGQFIDYPIVYGARRVLALAHKLAERDPA